MAFALSITALALAAHPALAALAAPQECDEDLCHMSHLQLQVSGIPNATNWAALGGVCLAELPEEYLTQPVNDVLQKHEWKEQDGWCVFGAVDKCISGCAVCRKLTLKFISRKPRTGFSRTHAPKRSAFPMALC